MALFDFSHGPKVMGILNVTPDSFSDGGRYISLDKALLQCQQMEKDGADILDIGGESTRPGAKPVSEQQELDRVIPVIEAIRLYSSIPISIDTSKPRVMAEAIGAGANMINDVSALQQTGAVEMAASLKVPVCLMHMQGEPRTMQLDPSYDDVVEDVTNFLLTQVDRCEAAGIPRSQIWLDPGFGFGKSLQHNLTLLKQIDKFVALRYPILVGISRKTMLGKITGRDVNERLAASLACVSWAAARGASIFRVHDVKETVDTLKVLKTIQELGQ
jgi:dihydropteroate synthase